MSARDELAAQVAEHGPFPMPVGAADEADRLRAELAGLRQGYAALEARCDYIAKAAVSWRKEADGRKAYGLTLRARVAELEALTPAPIQTCRSCGAGYDYGHPCSICEFKKRIASEIAKSSDEDSYERKVAAYLSTPYTDDGPRDLRPGAEAARRMIRDRQTAEDPHDSPLHRTYETGHDLPEYLYCGADLGGTTFPYTCHRRVGHTGDCEPTPDGTS